MKSLMRTTAAVLAVSAFSAGAAEIAPSAVEFTEDGAVLASLTGAAGDAANGAKVFANRKQGNCLACHANSDMEAELRGILTNSKMTFEGTIMPAFYIDAGYTRPIDKFDGKSILNAQQVEDILAYIMTLKEE